MALATFGILALELAIIRWTSGQVRIFAYFNNLVLISAFLGMGLGVALGGRRPGLVHWTLPSLALLSLVLAHSARLGIMNLKFPDPAVQLWGGETEGIGFVGNIAIFLSIVAGVVMVFVFAGAAVGHLFGQVRALSAYSADLVGSLLGVLALTAATLVRAGPPVWIGLGGLPFVWLSRRPLSLAGYAVAVFLAWRSGVGAIYSPYNRIDIETVGSSTMLSVNRDFHQYMHDLSDGGLARAGLSEGERGKLVQYRRAYDIPFVLSDIRGRALILGAGTGNDVQAALRNGYGKVFSVDIDPCIVELGRDLHPERPYHDARVVPVVNDARAFLEQYRGEPFDVVCYGLVDSHAMFTALSSLRLDNYMYTEEGIRAAWGLLSDKGHLTVSFSVYAGQWIVDRLYWTIARATGVRPLVIYHRMHFGATFLVARDPAILHGDRLQGFGQLPVTVAEDEVRTTSDDWPFLYVRPDVFPWGYLVVIVTVLVGALVSTWFAFGGRELVRRFDPVLFLFGAAFLLLEARGVTTLSLLFGSTWLVNSAIFGGVLLTVLLVNLAVARVGVRRLGPWFAALIVATVVVWRMDYAALNAFDLPLRGVIGSVITGLPIGFAGVVVSSLLGASSRPAAAIGSNLLGSVAGGCLEYLSMVLGLRAMALVALLLYLLALALHLRGRERA